MNIKSAQAAKLTAFTRAHIRAGMKVNIYTDNCYAFRVVHDFDMLYKQTGFMTAAGIPVKNGPQIAELLEALSLLQQITVAKPRDIAQNIQKKPEEMDWLINVPY